MTNIAVLLSLLNDTQTLKITPEGFSMCPFFLGERDDVYLAKPSFPLRKGDIALFQREDGRYVIHRVYRVRKSDTGTVYYMLGDNQTWIEGPITQEQIHAVTVKIMRKGRLIDCKKNIPYRALACIWLHIRPIRPLFIKMWIRLMPAIHRHQQKQQILAELNNKTPH